MSPSASPTAPYAMTPAPEDRSPVTLATIPDSAPRPLLSVRWRTFGALLLGVVLSGCADAKPFVAALDSLPLSSSFEAVKTVTQPGFDMCFNCPMVHRYYSVAGEPTALAHELRQAMSDAGFVAGPALPPRCDQQDNTGSLCSVTATMGSIQLLAVVYRPGADPDSLGLDQVGKATIRITAW
jgi:hypothetical protein